MGDWRRSSSFRISSTPNGNRPRFILHHGYETKQPASTTFTLCPAIRDSLWAAWPGTFSRPLKMTARFVLGGGPLSTYQTAYASSVPLPEVLLDVILSSLQLE